MREDFNGVRDDRAVGNLYGGKGVAAVLLEGELQSQQCPLQLLTCRQYLQLFERRE